VHDLYAILGVPPSASSERIAKAFRKLAFRHHPDRNPGREADAARAFQRIAEAYDVLSDPLKRALYDQRAGRVAASPRRSSTSAAPSRPTPRRRSDVAHRPAPPGRTATEPRHGLVARALFAIVGLMFTAGARLVGAILLMGGGRRFAAGSERARYDRFLFGLPRIVRALPPLARAAWWLGGVVYLTAPKILGEDRGGGASIDDVQNVAMIVSACGFGLLLIERLVFATFWAWRADRADPVRGAR
jgi:curved DNA-binding protein CbpA